MAPCLSFESQPLYIPIISLLSLSHPSSSSFPKCALQFADRHGIRFAMFEAPSRRGCIPAGQHSQFIERRNQKQLMCRAGLDPSRARDPATTGKGCHARSSSAPTAKKMNSSKVQLHLAVRGCDLHSNGESLEY